MHTYEYVTKREYKPVKREIEQIIRKAIRIMEDEYELEGIRYQLIGSGSRNLVTRIKGGNKGFDLDYNIIIQKPQSIYLNPRPDAIANQFMYALRRACEGTKYEIPHHKTSVFTLKCVDRKKSRIQYGADIAIIYYNNVICARSWDTSYSYLKHWDEGHYTFETQRMPSKIDKKLELVCEHENGWNKIREEYLKLKNSNEDINKRSFILYVEAVNNVYNQIIRNSINPSNRLGSRLPLIYL